MSDVQDRVYQLGRNAAELDELASYTDQPVENIGILMEMADRYRREQVEAMEKRTEA